MIKIGVSACVLGDKVRFDSGHKRNRFVCEELAEFVEFVPVCPEVGIGLPVPRPTIRLVDRDDLGIRLVDTKNIGIDHTDKMLQFSQKKLKHLNQQNLCGYVLCAKSPTCGMERVKIYRENGYSRDFNGVGLYAEQLMKHMPWLPIEEDGRLHDHLLRENFISRIFALNDLYQTLCEGISRKAIVEFHSRYKLILMAHSVEAYRQLGQLVAKVAQYDLDEFFMLYRNEFMKAMTKIATRKKHTNVLMHLQGYFKHALSSQEKAELTKLIHNYRKGIMPLLAPLTLLCHHLQQHPDPYIEQQKYLNPYPEDLRLRYSL